MGGDIGDIGGAVTRPPVRGAAISGLGHRPLTGPSG